MIQITYMQGMNRDTDVDKDKCLCEHKAGNRNVEQLGYWD